MHLSSIHRHIWHGVPPRHLKPFLLHARHWAGAVSAEHEGSTTRECMYWARVEIGMTIKEKGPLISEHERPRSDCKKRTRLTYAWYMAEKASMHNILILDASSCYWQKHMVISQQYDRDRRMEAVLAAVQHAVVSEARDASSTNK
jgi:hypothetical protein